MMDSSASSKRSGSAKSSPSSPAGLPVRFSWSDPPLKGPSRSQSIHPNGSKLSAAWPPSGGVVSIARRPRVACDAPWRAREIRGQRDVRL